MIEDLSVGCADTYPVHDVYSFADSSRQNGLTICDHDFDGVVEAVPPDRDGWHGFLLLYHCADVEPWHDAPWEIKDLGEFVQLLAVGAESAPEYCDKSKITKLIDFLREAQECGERVFVESS